MSRAERRHDRAVLQVDGRTLPRHRPDRFPAQLCRRRSNSGPAAGAALRLRYHHGNRAARLHRLLISGGSAPLRGAARDEALAVARERTRFLFRGLQPTSTTTKGRTAAPNRPARRAGRADRGPRRGQPEDGGDAGGPVRHAMPWADRCPPLPSRGLRGWDPAAFLRGPVFGEVNPSASCP